jgi:hypothetical protein
MEVTDADLVRVPARNLRVPRDEFAAVWSAAEAQLEEQTGRWVTDWYTGGVVVTCRWVARAIRAAGGRSVAAGEVAGQPTVEPGVLRS